jgi:hypothetical protein
MTWMGLWSRDAAGLAGRSLQSLVKGLSSPGAAWLIATNLGVIVLLLEDAIAASSLTGDVG